MSGRCAAPKNTAISFLPVSHQSFDKNNQSDIHLSSQEYSVLILLEVLLPITDSSASPVTPDFGSVQSQQSSHGSKIRHYFHWSEHPYNIESLLHFP